MEQEVSQQEPGELKYETLTDVIEVLKKLRINGTDEYHRAEIRLFEELAESLFELRLSKYVDGKGIKGFDRRLYEVLNRIREIFVGVVTGELAGDVKRGLYIVRRPVFLNGHVLRPGDLIVSDLDNVLNELIAGYIDIAKIERVDGNEGPEAH